MLYTESLTHPINTSDGTVNVPTLTPGAQLFLRRLLRTIRPIAESLNRRFGALLKSQHDDPVVRAILAITPVAAAQLRSFAAFTQQVEYNGRRLAKLNVSPGDVADALDSFDRLAAALLEGAFEPAREQLRLATQFVLGEAYYQVREAEAQTFYGLYRAEAEASNLEDLLRRFVRILTTAFRAASGSLLVSQAKRDSRLDHPLYIERGQETEQLVRDAGMRGRFASYWSYPLGDTGTIQFAFPKPYPWLPRERTLLDAVASRCREAVERTRLRQEVRRLELEARQAESEERRRIGRELHDEAGQSLLLIRLKLEMLERIAPVEMRPALAEVRGVTEQTVVELRRIIGALSPVILERLGLRKALYQLAARFRKIHRAEIRVRVAAKVETIPRQIEEVIYRVAQECLHNVAKHSDATQVKLFLLMTDKNVRLGVQDNGIGSPKRRLHRNSPGFGLAGMRERAALLSGTLEISSQPGKGFSVLLNLPRSSAMGWNGLDSNG